MVTTDYVDFRVGLRTPMQQPDDREIAILKKDNRGSFVMIGITDEDVDKKCVGIKHHNNYFTKRNKTCIGFGDVDFENTEDLKSIIKLIDTEIASGIRLPYNYNYSTNHGGGLTESFDFVKFLQYKHASIGKPKNVAIYLLK